MLAEPVLTVLGPESTGRVKTLNGNAFQQEGIVTFNGWQYASWYGAIPNSKEEV